MLTVAVIEDDLITSDQLKGWINGACTGARVDQWRTRDEATAAIGRDRYDAVILNIELGQERHGGFAVINAVNKRQGIPVLVISRMPANPYRGIVRALDAWGYLQKGDYDEAEFVDTLLDMLRPRQTPSIRDPGSEGREQELSLDPLRQSAPLWKGQRIELPLTAQRILNALYGARGHVVSYHELFQVVKTGRNRENIRKHVATIREALRERDPTFNRIENVPLRGFRWVEI